MKLEIIGQIIAVFPAYKSNNIMKTNNFFNKNCLLGILCLPLVFTACSKDDNVGVGESSEIKITNAAETSGSQDFYLNDTKVNNSAITYNESTEGYISIKSGNDQVAEFRTAGSTTAYTSTEIDLNANKNYSFFLYGEGASSSIYTTEDDLSTPSGGKAKIRFVHLSTAANESLDVNMGDTKLVAGLNFKSPSSFTEIDPGLHVFQLYNAGTTSDPINLNLAALGEGKIYTVLISGSSSVKATLINNN